MSLSRALLLFLLLVLPARAGAQLRPTAASSSPLLRPSAPPPHPPAVQHPSGPTLVFAGVTGMATGAIAGAIVGAGLAGCGGGEEDCGLAAGVYGGMAGMSLGIPLAIHLVNHSRGNFGRELALSGALFLGGITYASAAHDATALLIIPVAQIVGSIWLELDEGGANDR